MTQIGLSKKPAKFGTIRIIRFSVIKLTRQKFEALVVLTLKRSPKFCKKQMKGVHVVVEPSARASFISMRSILVTALMSGIALFVPSCIKVPTQPLALGELRLLSITTAERMEIKRNVPFEAKINFEADGEPEIRSACFYWGGDGPHCFKVTDVDYGPPGVIKIKLTARRSGSYALESYVVYTRGGKGEPTNIVFTDLRVLQ